ncbi:peroxiredoxin [Geothrix sp. 21YS21S-2]|uniref:peroxiredoxin n=1 Tax=Geothrix sp. 21YS21S-2 TaxID=3068893 RepID=UPI0027BB0B66|nr:peroxiredoxin [Geothrix sp. 21YS21S-2]
MAAFVTQPAPDFKATALVNGEFKEVTLSQYKGRKVVLFFYPLDFTFVCPTEILAFSDAVKEFEARDTQVLGVSVDSHFSHWAWANTEIKNGGIKGVSFPLVSDLSKSIAADYNVLLPGGIALRGLFLVDEAGILRHITVNDLPLGRNVEEVLRVVDALDFHTKNGEVCPANWKKGDKAMKPTQEGLREYAANH